MSPRALGLLAAAALAVTVGPNAKAQALSYRLPPALADPPQADTLASGADRTEALGAARARGHAEAREADDWFGRDKLYHLGASFGLALGAHVALTEGAGMERPAAAPMAAGFALSLGLAKEYADRQRPRNPLFSWKDLAADALGAALGVAVAGLQR